MPDESPELSPGDAFLLMEYEANQNGNTNWCFFPESAARFRDMAQLIFDAIQHDSKPEVAGDDADEAHCLLSGMIHDDPNELPTNAESYAPLRRELERLGLLEYGPLQSPW